jgi:hypothetical protein
MIFIRVSEINIMYIQYEYRGLLSTGLRFRAGARLHPGMIAIRLLVPFR